MNQWYKISNLEIPIQHQKDIRELIGDALQLPADDIAEIELLRKSVDARHKNRLKFIYSAAFRLKDSAYKPKHPRVTEYAAPQPPEKDVVLNFDNRPVIVGFGPAGIFAALALAEKGLQPIIFERGKMVPERITDVNQLWEHGILDENSNVQFGEGGAGTFSDGKLTARNQNYFTGEVLKTLVRFGAPEEIMYLQKPHIGTDRLRLIIPKIREHLISKGAEFHFNSMVSGLMIKDSKISGIIVNGDPISAQQVILAIGHSARDLVRQMQIDGVHLEAKAFAIGVRVEHPADFLNTTQFGDRTNFSISGPADYKLTWTWKRQQRGVYSFCMCPGGKIILSSSQAGGLVTNGMSNYARNLGYSNSGIVVSVRPEDFPPGALGGIEFQERIERRAFELGGSTYNAPAQHLGDFVQNRTPKQIGKGTFRPGMVPVPMKQVLPSMVVDALSTGFMVFERRIPGYIENGLLVAPETRTSSPVRIVRNSDTGESVNVQGLYPIGEGAGYAGGIVSSAADGLKLGYRVKSR